MKIYKKFSKMLKKYKVYGFFAIFFFLMGGILYSSSNFKVINASDLKRMIEKREIFFLLIDSRTEEEYNYAHIEGAISIPVEKMDDMKSYLPKDKETLLIFYCNGVKCGKSKNAALKAKNMGYINIMVFDGGIPEWREKGYPLLSRAAELSPKKITLISAEDLKHKIDRKENIMIVDVREPDEFLKAHIPSAVNIPLGKIEKSQDMLPKDKEIILYCNSSNRSNLAGEKLIDLGYKTIKNMEGINEWINKGFDIKKDRD